MLPSVVNTSNYKSIKSPKNNTNVNLGTNVNIYDHLAPEVQGQIKRSEENLRYISEAIDELKQIALDMGLELNNHNEMLKIITPNVTASTRKVDKLTAKTRRQI